MKKMVCYICLLFCFTLSANLRDDFREALSHFFEHKSEMAYGNLVHIAQSLKDEEAFQTEDWRKQTEEWQEVALMTGVLVQLHKDDQLEKLIREEVVISPKDLAAAVMFPFAILSTCVVFIGALINEPTSATQGLLSMVVIAVAFLKINQDFSSFSKVVNKIYCWGKDTLKCLHNKCKKAVGYEVLVPEPLAALIVRLQSEKTL